MKCHYLIVVNKWLNRKMSRCELWHAHCHNQGRSKQRQFLKKQ